MCGLLVICECYLLVLISLRFTFPWIQIHISSVVLFLRHFYLHSVQDSPHRPSPKGAQHPVVLSPFPCSVSSTAIV